jgi:tetratricopeptide (TPR) repeat protein
MVSNAGGPPQFPSNPLLYLTQNPGDHHYRATYRSRQRLAFKGRETEMIRKASSRVGLRLVISRRSDPAEIMIACEEKLQSNPFDVTYLLKLGEAAQALSLTDTAIQTFTDVVELCGKATDAAGFQGVKKDALRSLGLVLYSAERFEEANKVLKRFAALYGLDGETAEFRGLVEKDIDAQIMSTTYGTATGARDLVRDQGGTEKLRDVNEGPRSDDEIRVRVAELEVTLASGDTLATEKLRAAVEAGRLYERLGDLDAAIDARARGAEFDTSTDSTVAVAKLKVLKATRNASRARGAADETEGAGAEAFCAEAERRAWLTVVSEYGELMQRMPTVDEEIPLALGEAYFELGRLEKGRERIKLAVSQFQRRYKREDNEYRARILLGRAFGELCLFPLAKRQFGKVLSAVDDMRDAAKREIVFEALYELAHIQLDDEDLDGALDSLGKVYEQDRRWRDVEEMILRLNDQAMTRKRA